jgi:hypothetical protein
VFFEACLCLALDGENHDLFFKESGVDRVTRERSLSVGRVFTFSFDVAVFDGVVFTVGAISHFWQKLYFTFKCLF